MSIPLPGSAGPALVTLGGRDLILTPIPPADAWKFRKAAVTKIQAKMRDPAELALRAVAQARAAGEPLSAEDRSALFREALDAAAGGKREPTDAEIHAWTMTAEGMREFVFLTAVGNKPLVTREWLKEVLTEDNLVDFLTGGTSLVAPVEAEPADLSAE
ncbi:hypothetical protein [Limnoglobus roseus]|uniref:Uncharacterized protein n=1 Tax=Limnoglobus roseus TaxID=2598579 RepID=A0A5C1AID8_9BACT|nr:hypothetical protein [Limnoglobus roseus]QEL17442.1 hypothetical protein PX52LOC_04431 [Limnoglobus roseus]